MSQIFCFALFASAAIASIPLISFSSLTLAYGSTNSNNNVNLLNNENLADLFEMQVEYLQQFFVVCL